MDLNIMFRAYDGFGADWNLMLLDFLLVRDMPECGSSINEIWLELNLPTSGPPNATLGSMYEKHHADRRKPPSVKFGKKSRKVTIEFASDFVDASHLRSLRAPNAKVIADAYPVVKTALALIRDKLSRGVDFDFEKFMGHIADMAPKLPKSAEELTTLDSEHRRWEAERRASKSPWDFLEINWRKFHPKARQLLDDPFYWSCDDDFSPHGNDTGADLLAAYGKWRKRSAGQRSVDFLENEIASWGPASGYEEESYRFQVNEARVALAFAEIKYNGDCPADVAVIALEAIANQRNEAEALTDWEHREDRLRTLAQLQSKIEQCKAGREQGG